jgi:imidazolonepropionase-like amidohydrolase
MTVVVQGTRIVTVDKAREVRVPPTTRVVDGTGRFLIPGLWDMHVHSAANADRDLPLFLAFGVTGVRNMHSTVDTALALTNAVRRRVRAGTLLGPRFVANGPIIDGPQPTQRGAVAVADAGEATRAVDSLVRGGAEFIKVHNLLPRDALKAVFQQAKNRRVPVVGHVPIEARAIEVSVAGQRSIEHLDGLDFACSTREDSLRENLLAQPSPELWQSTRTALVATWSASRCRPTIDAYKTNVTWQVPTLVTGWVLASADSVLADEEAMAVVPRATRAAWRAVVDSMPGEEARYERDWFARKLETVGLLHRAGVPILAGSDAGNPLLVPGYSLHQEMALLVRAGLTPIEALRTATIIPARFFGRGDELGTIVPGKLADLVLLDADPREDIANARRIRAVVANGRYLNRTALDAILRRAASATARGRE